MTVTQRLLAIARRSVTFSILFPFALGLGVLQSTTRVLARLSLRLLGPSVYTEGVRESQFPGYDYLETVIFKLDTSGLRSTASHAHNEFISWIRNELSRIPNLSVTLDEYEILRWQTKEERTLKQAGSLVIKQGRTATEIDVAGAVPFSRPSSGSTGQLTYVHSSRRLSSESIKGKVVVRNIPDRSLPMILARLPALSTTPDIRFDYFSDYNRPSFWEHPMHDDLIAAGMAGAVGLIFVIDLPRSQLESYWDPHQGTHYEIPALFCAAEDIATLIEAASHGMEATVTVRAEVSKAMTANVLATLPGQVAETVVYATHTDGNTCVQDNGVAALLALARYFGSEPLSSRRRTLQFAFNTAHLQVSKEGSGRHAQQLDASYDKDKTLALVIPVEHLGTRELAAKSTPDGNNRYLDYTGQGEVMIWCVGPSVPLVAAVEDAVERRKLDRVLVTRGVGLPRLFKLPTYKSFGGLGTLYNAALLPTTSIISGPWSLFAPSFGPGAVDVERMRRQTLALGDLYLAIDGLTREQIAGGYVGQRRRRQQGGTKVYEEFVYPPETLDRFEKRP